jgi:hypothetical protein
MPSRQGPLSTFARKIALGHALRLYDADFRDNLDIIRSIRNAFAHSKRLIDFDHPLVSREIDKIKISKSLRRTLRKIKRPVSPRQAYVTLCLRLVTGMLRKRSAVLQRSTKRQGKKLATSPFYQALAPALGLGGIGSLGMLGGSLGSSLVAGFPLASSGSIPQSSPAGRTGGPTTEAPLGLLGGLFQEPPKTGGSEDK